MKINKLILSLVTMGVLFSGCQSVKETLSTKKKQNTNEFLIKKKEPLVLPPDFEKLPTPQSDEIETLDKEKKVDFSKLLKKSDKQKNKNNNNSLEKSISKILNKN
jgi:hypothetical protein